MSSFTSSTYADAQTLAGVDRATHLIEPIAAFIGGAVRGGVTTLLMLATLIVVGLAVQRIDALAHSPLIDLAAIVGFASLAIALLPARRAVARKA